MSEIYYINANWSRIENPSERVKELLTYQKQEFKLTPRGYRPTGKIVDHQMIFKNSTTLSGLGYYLKQKMPKEVELEGFESEVELFDYKIKGVKWRKGQARILKAIKENSITRGVIKAPTGSGKTYIIAGLVSLFRECKFLILAHRIDLINNLAETFEEMGLNYGVIGGGEAFLPKGAHLLAVINSYSKMVEDYSELRDFDGVIIDEVHHANKINSRYGQTLIKLKASVRFGLSATPHGEQSDRLKFLAQTGLVGPLVAEQSLDQAYSDGDIIKPIVKLVNVPVNAGIAALTNYREIYSRGIVENSQRNEIILDIIEREVKQKRSVLTIVKEVKHGKELQRALRRRKVKSKFLDGSKTSEERERGKRTLHKKSLKSVIVTEIWREGVNVPSLDNVVNACGGKSEIATLQVIGRGLRTHKGKEKIVVWDMLDPYKYLAEHSIARIQLYNNMEFEIGGQNAR